MVYYAAVLITCLIFVCEIVQVTATHESINAKKKTPNNTVIRVFNNDYNCNVWRKISPELVNPCSSAAKNKNTHFHSNSTWTSNTSGDPYFDGYLGNLTHKNVDKVGLFKAIKKILDRKTVPITENILTENKISDYKSHATGGRKEKEKDLGKKVYSDKKANDINNQEKLHQAKKAQVKNTCEENFTSSQLMTNLESASHHLEKIAKKIENELKNLYKIRLDMEKSVCGKVVSWDKNKKWGEWSNWSACSVTCGIGTQVRDRIANTPERGRPTIEIEMKPCRLPDCSPASLLFYSANNLLRSLISFRNYTHDN